MKDFFLRRFSEPSTWMGALAVATAFGVPLTETQMTALASFGAALCFIPDKQHR